MPAAGGAVRAAKKAGGRVQRVPGHHPVLDVLARRLGALPSVRRVILFGSRARGDHDQRADIDLAVDCPAASREDWGRIWNAVDDAPTLLKVDLVRLDEAGDEFRAEIEREGIVLYDHGKG